MAFKIADVFLEAVLDWSKADQQAGQMENKILGMTKGTVSGLATGFGVAGAAITGSLGLMAGKAATFGEKLASVSTLGVKDLGALDTGVRDLAVKFGLDLNDSVGVVYEALSAGIPEDAAIMVMEQAAKGAQAGMGSLAEAMDVGTGIMNAWNLKGKDANETTANFERIMGEVAVAVKVGKTTMADMASSIGQVAPLMATAGVNSTEFNAAVAALTATNLPAASAMTGLRSAVSNILTPTEKAKEVAASLGLEFNATALSSKGLSGFLQEVKDKTGGNIETMGQLFGNVEGLGAVMSLTGNQADLFKSTLTDMGSAQKTLNEMSMKYIENNPALAFNQGKAAISSLVIDIGRGLLPALGMLMKIAVPILGFLSEVVRFSPTLTAIVVSLVFGLGAIATGLSAVGFTMLGLMPLFPALATSAAGAGAGAAGASIGFGALASSIGACLLAALPWIAIAAALAAAAYFVIPSIMETKSAYDQLSASQAASQAKFAEYEAMLIRQGVALDQAALKQMSDAERSAALTSASIAHKEAMAAREIQLITGIEATRQQIHIAELARVGLGVSAKEAASMAVQGITQAEIQSMMAKGQVEQQVAQQSAAVQAQAAATSHQFEIQGRTDKTESIGHFQWAADKEAAMLAKASELKGADHYMRKLIMSDLARMESEKAAAERAWANENQALTATEIAGLKYAADAKEAKEQRWLDITEGRIRSEKDMLYTDQSQEIASVKVHGDAITRQRAFEAAERKRISEQSKETESSLESKLGEEKLAALNKTLQAVQEHSGLEKSSAADVSQFKATLLQGDLDTSMQFWTNMREQTNAGLTTNLEQYQSFSQAMKAEAAALRKELAYAMNPAQTGSPSLNQEAAMGYGQYVNLLHTSLSGAESRAWAFRDVMAETLLVGAGILGGGTPKVSDGLISGGGGLNPMSPGVPSGSGGQSGAVYINAPVTVSGTYTVPDTKTANALVGKIGDEVAKRLGDKLIKEMRGLGMRRPGSGLGGVSVQPS